VENMLLGSLKFKFNDTIDIASCDEFLVEDEFLLEYCKFEIKMKILLLLIKFVNKIC
jgi:hypothetical protein